MKVGNANMPGEDGSRRFASAKSRPDYRGWHPAYIVEKLPRLWEKRDTGRRERYVLTCIALVNWTDQGVKNVRETLARTEAVDKLVDDFGIKNWRLYWTMGPHDLVSIFDAPDDKSATTFVLAVGSGGNVRTTTMRAYDRDEMSEIIEKLG